MVSDGTHSIALRQNCKQCFPPPLVLSKLPVSSFPGAGGLQKHPPWRGAWEIDLHFCDKSLPKALQEYGQPAMPAAYICKPHMHAPLYFFRRLLSTLAPGDPGTMLSVPRVRIKVRVRPSPSPSRSAIPAMTPNLPGGLGNPVGLHHGALMGEMVGVDGVDCLAGAKLARAHAGWSSACKLLLLLRKGFQDR